MSSSELAEAVDVSPYLNCAALVSDRSAYTVALLELLDDPDADRHQISELVSADPVLVSKLLVLANSAWIAARAPSTNVWDASRVLGLTMVRNLAAATLVDLSSSNPHLPTGYLEHAIASAAGAAAVAERVGGKVRDAWSVALLHDLGVVLLASAHGREAVSSAGRSILSEEQRFGLDHATLGAAVLGEMRMPNLVCETIREHIEPPDLGGSPMSLTVRAGIAMAESAGVTGSSAPVGEPEPFLRRLGLEREQAEIATDLETHADRLTDLLK
ncbi:MAG: HDOD domain-containing protein [Actinomycetia bacterium]|nr:HDOD domain-containing protein [Actinomycetes bacterium]MCP4957768.1 HDOD domain-containing protein [Actinomycetes bacterium]